MQVSRSDDYTPRSHKWQAGEGELELEEGSPSTG